MEIPREEIGKNKREEENSLKQTKTDMACARNRR